MSTPPDTVLNRALLARVAGSVFGAGLVYSLVEPLAIVVRRFNVVMEHLPPEADGLKIAQLSDLHCSAITSFSVVRGAVTKCNLLCPDVVMLTGDFVSRRNSYMPFTFARQWAHPILEYAERVAEALKCLRAPLGVFAVPGNHDHTQGRFDAIQELLQNAGITTLLNSQTCLRGVLPLAGIDDLRAGQIHIRPALHSIERDEAQIILSHNPRTFHLFSDRNCLVLTGHTHGGQVRLPGTRFRRRPADMHFSPWIHGWYRFGRAQMYVSSGIGSVHFPMRFRCPPEIALFTLRRA